MDNPHDRPTKTSEPSFKRSFISNFEEPMFPIVAANKPTDELILDELRALNAVMRELLSHIKNL
jgi:hypothetical protein